MAGRSSDDLPAGSARETAETQQTLEDAAQTLSDGEQSRSDSDQTSADSDQTSADSDQTSADSDQTSADSDQRAADRDQAASDRAFAQGVDPRQYELSHDVRERTSRERERSSLARDRTAQARLEAAGRRDDVADMRDHAARTRDAAAEARHSAMSLLDATTQQEEEARTLSGADRLVRAAGQRKRAAQRRALASRQREMAAEDRRAAAADREQAARERVQARVDREVLVAELHREQARRDEALRHQERAESLARTLQRSLSPPSLPPVAGIDVAVHYEPFASEEVGGDFYDLFPLAGGRSGFFLGDVCGKGPDAATLTSLARYTMRTAAMLREQPAAILEDLNEALLMAGAAQMKTVTVVYGEIDTSGGPAAITLAVAGHPAPVIVRAGGDVAATLAHGTMLGAIPRPVFAPCAVALEPGDTIVVYSDGILDAEIGGVRIDEPRVNGLLDGPPHASAQDLVDRLICALRSIDRPLRDDVAVMALRRTPAG